MIIQGTFDGKEVRITFNGEGKPCRLFMRYVEPIDMVKFDDEFNNPRMLSASLRCELGYKNCCILLASHNIDKSSGLWALNHDGYPSEDWLTEIMEEHNENSAS